MIEFRVVSRNLSETAGWGRMSWMSQVLRSAAADKVPALHLGSVRDDHADRNGASHMKSLCNVDLVPFVSSHACLNLFSFHNAFVLYSSCS